jgi:SAM-dependent methyltransferase
MGINASDAKMLRSLVPVPDGEGRCLTLGCQDIEFGASEWAELCRQSTAYEVSTSACENGEYSRPDVYLSNPEASLSDVEFFAELGFGTLHSVDASRFEGAEICFDLNQRGLANEINAPYDLIYESGTMEHVFHVPNYLANLADSLKVGGRIIQRLPVNNFVDHGFYQISPTLLESYYRANKFCIEALLLIVSQDPRGNQSHWRAYEPGEFDTVNKEQLGRHYLSVLVVARKTEHSSSDAIPQQRVYSQNLNWSLGLSSIDLAQLPVTEAFEGPFKQGEGYCWMIRVQDKSLYGDSPADTKCSKLVLLENNNIMGQAHALHEQIRELGGGLYSHWEGVLYFSTPDGTDPNTNGRTYTVKVLP